MGNADGELKRLQGVVGTRINSYTKFTTSLPLSAAGITMGLREVRFFHTAERYRIAF